MDFEADKTPLVSYALPKADMHVHISLALPEEIFLKRIKKKRTKDLGPEFLIERTSRYYDTLAKFHATYENMRYLTNTSYELAQVTQLYLERIAREGAIYAEISNSFRGESEFDAQIEAIEEGIRVAKHNTGIEARIVVTALRRDGMGPAGRGPEHALAAARHVARTKPKYVTGFGIVGVENLDSMLDYQRPFEIAWHEAGLGLSPHVAEQYLQNAVQYLALLDRMGLQVEGQDSRRLRMGHATLIHMSTDLMERFKAAGICLETCLSANKRINLPEDSRAMKIGDDIGGIVLDRPLACYFSDVTGHPLPDFIKAGLSVALGSDNPLLMNTNIGKEYSLAVKAGLNTDQLLDCTESAITHANLDLETRKELWLKVDNYRNFLTADYDVSQTALGYKHPYNRF